MSQKSMSSDDYDYQKSGFNVDQNNQKSIFNLDKNEQVAADSFKFNRAFVEWGRDPWEVLVIRNPSSASSYQELRDGLYYNTLDIDTYDLTSPAWSWNPLVMISIMLCDLFTCMNQPINARSSVFYQSAESLSELNPRLFKITYSFLYGFLVFDWKHVVWGLEWLLDHDARIFIEIDNSAEDMYQVVDGARIYLHFITFLLLWRRLGNLLYRFPILLQDPSNLSKAIFFAYCLDRPTRFLTWSLVYLWLAPVQFYLCQFLCIENYNAWFYLFFCSLAITALKCYFSKDYKNTLIYNFNISIKWVCALFDQNKPKFQLPRYRRPVLGSFDVPYSDWRVEWIWLLCSIFCLVLSCYVTPTFLLHHAWKLYKVV